MPFVVPIIAYYATVGYVGAFAATLIAAGASFIVSKLTAPKSQSFAAQEARGRTQVVRSAVADRRVAYGRVKLSGPLTYAVVHGADNEYLSMVVALTSNQCDGVEEYWLNDTRIYPGERSEEEYGLVNSGPYSNYAFLKFHKGFSSGEVEPRLTTDDPLRWTGAHLGKGVSWLYIKLLWNHDVYPTGIPNPAVVLRGKPLYDPRTGLTLFSDNWALCVLDYLMAPYGLRCTTSDIDLPSFIAAANVSDELVAIPGGQQNRYRCNGTVNLGIRRIEVLEQLLSAGAGILVYSQGKYKLYAGSYRSPTASFNESHLAGAVEVSPRTERKDLFNAVRGTYVSPGDGGWQPTDFAPVRNSVFAAEDGEEIYKDIDLPFTTNAYAAQRIAKLYLGKARDALTVSIVYNLAAFKLQAGDCITQTLSMFGWVDKEFIVTSWQMNPDASISVGLQEENSNVYAWASGDAVVLNQAANTNLPNPYFVAAPTDLVLTSGSSESVVVTGGQIISRIKVTWVPPPNAFVKSGGRIEIQSRRSFDPLWIPSPSSRGDETVAYITPVKDGLSYDVRIRAVNAIGTKSAWTQANQHVVGAKFPYNANENLVPNGNSEMGVAAIGLVPEGVYLINDPANSYTGNWCRRLTIGAVPFETGVSPTVLGAPGDDFYFEARVKASSPLAFAKCFINIAVIDQAGNYPGTIGTYFIANSLATTTYKKISISGHIPDGYIGVRAQIGTEANPSDTGKHVYFDSLYMRRLVNSRILGVAYGANLVFNSSPQTTLDGWSSGGTHPHVFGLSRISHPERAINGREGMYLYQATATGNMNEYCEFASQTPERWMSVEAGRRYEVSAYLGVFRCRAQIIITWYNSASVLLGESGHTFESTNAQEALGGITMDSFKRVYLIVDAPSGASKARFWVRKYNTEIEFWGSNPTSYLFAARLMFAGTSPFATEISPWVPTGFTQLGFDDVATRNMEEHAATDLSASDVPFTPISGIRGSPNTLGHFTTVASLSITPEVNADAVLSATGTAVINAPGLAPENELFAIIDAGTYNENHLVSLLYREDTTTYASHGFSLVRHFPVLGGVAYTFSFRAQTTSGLVPSDVVNFQFLLELIKR